MSSNAKDSWSELEQLAELAETPEDFELVQRLLLEREALAGTGDRLGKWVVETLGEVADFFGMSLPSMWAWRAASDPMPGEEGHWDLKEITAWRCDRLKANNGSQKSPVMLELEERELRASVEKKELVLRNERGLLVEREAVAAQLAALLNDCRNQIEAIPSELGPSIPAELRSELQHQMSQRVALILRKMSQRSET